MTWFVLICISLLAAVGATLSQRQVAKEAEANSLLLAFLFQISMGALVVSYLILFVHIPFGKFPSKLPYILLAGLLYGLAHLFIFIGLKRIDAGYFAILFSLRAVVTIVASSLLLKEGLTHIQIIGFIGLFLGIIISHLQPNKTKLRSFWIGGGAVVFAALLYGTGATNDKYFESIHLRRYPISLWHCCSSYYLRHP